MGGSSISVECEFTSPLNRTLVLLGRTGNGKSATGNSILQRKAFGSRFSSKGVTKTCEQQRTVLPDGMILNVIDTPGLFDFSAESEFIRKEIVKCIDMAKDGIHAALLVLSVRTLFTGGDELEDDETLEDYLGRDFPEPKGKIVLMNVVASIRFNLSISYVLKILLLCENRRVLFDNKTKDVKKKTKQVQELLSLVDAVLTKNGRKPYTHDIFVEMKNDALKLHDQTERVLSMEGHAEDKHTSNEEQLKRITEMVCIFWKLHTWLSDVLRSLMYSKWCLKNLVNQMDVVVSHVFRERNRIANLLANVGCIDRKFLLFTRWEELVESKLRETTRKLEQQLAEEQAARLKVEENAQAAQMKSNDEIRELRGNLQKTQMEMFVLQNRPELPVCLIL
ncbi:hypothetical protein LguiA_029096 [Lonicera macranthoides]